MAIPSPKILAILPSLNEEVSIANTIISIRKIYPKTQILVVDNGSRDKTVEIAMKLKAKVIHEPQLGKGFAIRSAFKYVENDVNVVFMVDADDTYGMERLIEATHLITQKGYDMVIGNRIESETKEPNRKSGFKTGHNLGNLFFTRLSKLLYPVNISDSLSGWRVMSPAFVRSFPGGATGFEIEAELNAHAYLIKAACTNLDIIYRGRNHNSHSKLNTYRDGIKILIMNLRNFRNDRPSLAFNLLSLPWLTISGFLILRAIKNFLKTGMVLQFPSLIAGVGAFIISALLCITGMILQRIKLLRTNLLRIEYKKSTLWSNS